MTQRPVHYGTGLPGFSLGVSHIEDLQRLGVDPDVLRPDYVPMANEVMSEEIGITFHPTSDWEETPPASLEGVSRRYSSDQFGDWEVPRTEHMILRPSRFLGTPSANDWQPGEHPESEGRGGLLSEARGVLRVVTSPWSDRPGWEDIYARDQRVRPSDVYDLRMKDEDSASKAGPINIPVLGQRLIRPAFHRPPRRAGDPVNKWGGTWKEDETDEKYLADVGRDSFHYKFLASPDMDIGRPVEGEETSALFTPGYRLARPSFLVELEHDSPPEDHSRPPLRRNISTPGEAIDATTGNAHVFVKSYIPEEAFTDAGEWPGGGHVSEQGQVTHNAPGGVMATHGQYAQLAGGGYLSMHQFDNPPERLDPNAWTGRHSELVSEPREDRLGLWASDEDTNKRNIEFAPDMVRIAHSAWQRQMQDWASILRGDHPDPDPDFS